MQNINTLATAAGCWVTFDINQGKWAVVINQAGSSIKSFSDSNIIGAITVTGTGIAELYNSVQVDFPHIDLLDQKDTIVYSIAAGNRFTNEQDNTLNFQLDCVNDPVQIETLAIRELKQSRIDKIIRFSTDFTSLGLKAGDLIDVTATMYGFSSKVFRILSISEEDGDDNTLVLAITAFEYDSTVYDTTGLTREERNITTDIVSKSCNTATTASDNEAGLPLDLSNIAKALGLTLLFNNLTGRWEMTQGGQQVNIAGDTAVITWTFPDGSDLDIRCRMISPFMGQNTVDDFLGYTGGGGGTSQYPTNSRRYWPTSPPYVLSWGGDNTGTGSEAVAVNISQLKTLFPNQQYFIVECRGNWFVTPGLLPIQLNATLYQGGTLAPSAPISPATVGFNFIHTGYTKGRTIEGLSVFIESNYGGTVVGGYDGTTAPGDLMGYFVFDAVNNTAQFRNDLTGYA
jgi:hypothetical protein